MNRWWVTAIATMCATWMGTAAVSAQTTVRAAPVTPTLQVKVALWSGTCTKCVRTGARPTYPGTTWSEWLTTNAKADASGVVWIPIPDLATVLNGGSFPGDLTETRLPAGGPQFTIRVGPAGRTGATTPLLKVKVDSPNLITPPPALTWLGAGELTLIAPSGKSYLLSKGVLVIAGVGHVQASELAPLLGAPAVYDAASRIHDINVSQDCRLCLLTAVPPTP